MNILPKKSWHVRNKDNVAKVRRDEENARLKEKEQVRRAELAEREARTSYLREKARKRALKDCDDELSDHGKKIVLKDSFSSFSLEQCSTSSLKNAEHEKEKKDEQHNYEKKIGLLTYLGQSAAETLDDSDKPWYFQAPKQHLLGKKRKTLLDEDEQETDLKRKNSLDPIQTMQSHLQKKRLADRKKEKKPKKKHKHRTPEKDIVPQKPTANEKLAKLREERLRREKKERERTMALLNGPDICFSHSSISKPGQYNSQFNPHLVRHKH